jgi:hypothetical protein
MKKPTPLPAHLRPNRVPSSRTNSNHSHHLNYQDTLMLKVGGKDLSADAQKYFVRPPAFSG